jgi:hypothetical protein
MPASPMVRGILEHDRMLMLMPAAAREMLEQMTPEEEILLRGVAHVGRDLGYFVVTQRGIHYTDREKVGLFKKREFAGFIARDDLGHVDVEQFRNLPTYAYLRLHGPTGERVGSVWFEDEFGDESAEAQAYRMAAALGVE